MWSLSIKRKGANLLIIFPISVSVQVWAFIPMFYEAMIGSYTGILTWLPPLGNHALVFSLPLECGLALEIAFNCPLKDILKF